MPPRPKVLRGCCVGYSHVHSQQAGRAGLGAAGNNVIVAAFGCPVAVVRGTTIISQRLQRETASVPKKVGYEVVGKGFHQILLIGIASEVADRRDGHGDVRQQTRPARFYRVLALRVEVRWGATPGRTIRYANARHEIVVFRGPGYTVLSSTARTRDFICQQLRLDIRCDAQFALQGLGAALVLTERFTTASSARVSADQRALPEF